MKKRNITARLVTRGEAEKEFDRQFWRDAGSEARFAAMWEMVVEAELMKGRELSDLKLRRDVGRLIRRGEEDT